MNHKNVLAGLEVFVEDNDEDVLFNDLLIFWDLYISTPIPPPKVNSDVMLDIAKNYSVKVMFRFFRIMAHTHVNLLEHGKKANENHSVYLCNYEKTIGKNFMSFMRDVSKGGCGTEEERKIANEYIDNCLECKYNKFLKTRNGKELYVPSV